MIGTFFLVLRHGRRRDDALRKHRMHALRCVRGVEGVIDP
jgi:hypothetical protein